MAPSQNLWQDRYEWASEHIINIFNEKNIECFTLFDIGSRDNILKKHLLSIPVSYKGFDLDPIGPETEKWNIEEPFSYSHQPPHVVALLEVIEHLKNPGICLDNIGKIVQPGGYLILTTPNPQWSTSRLSLLFTGVLTCFTQSDLDVNHHVFTPWVHVVEKLLKDAGFEVQEYVTLEGKTKIFDGNLRGGNSLKKLIARVIKKLIERRDPASCGMSYGIIAKKI
jgi:hypothetical protein